MAPLAQDDALVTKPESVDEPHVGAQSIPATQTRTPGLKKIPPYWYAYTTMAKERWLGREILEMVSTEFRDRSMEYYRFALESGVTTINGKVAKPDTVIRNGDRIENVVHRHEPPVTSTPVRVLLHDKEREFIVVDKPGSIPVHPAGRYHRNSLLLILQDDFGFKKVYPINRLDRLTSGLMIIPLSSERARLLTDEFMVNTVKKIYVARCSGRFPEEEIVCDEPLLTVDRQMGLNIVHPEGKPAKTIFNLIRYDPETDSSVVKCQPVTGRSHQIRVHLQYLGYPIANDPVYSEKKIWGNNLGRGGIDIVPSEERSAPAPPPHLAQSVSEGGNPEALSKDETSSTGSVQPNGLEGNGDSITNLKKLLPRETGHDIGMGSPVPLSSEAVRVITNLRNMKDEDEDWSRWRDIVFRAKKALVPVGVFNQRPLPPPHRRERGGPTGGKSRTSGKGKQKAKKQQQNSEDAKAEVSEPESVQPGLREDPLWKPYSATAEDPSLTSTVQEEVVSVQLTETEALEKAQTFASAEPLSVSASTAEPNDVESYTPSSPPTSSPSQPSDPSAQASDSASAPPPCQANAAPSTTEQQTFALDDDTRALYCSECYLPLHPDPKPEKLYIFLHALRYTTGLGTYETEMPEWAAPDFTWDKS